MPNETKLNEKNNEELTMLANQYGALHLLLVTGGDNIRDAGNLNAQDSQKIIELVKQNRAFEKKHLSEQIFPATIDYHNRVLIKAVFESSEDFLAVIFPIEVPLRHVDECTHQIANQLGKFCSVIETFSKEEYISGQEMTEEDWQSEFIHNYQEDKREKDNFLGQKLIDSTNNLRPLHQDLSNSYNFQLQKQNNAKNPYDFRKIIIK